MKKLLFVICAMLLACASVANAQGSTEKIQFSGTLVNSPVPVKDYRIQVCETGKDKRVLEEVRPEEDGSFYVAAYSDRPVRLVVLDKKKKVVVCRTFFGTEGNHKLNLNQVDLSKDKTNEKH